MRRTNLRRTPVARWSLRTAVAGVAAPLLCFALLGSPGCGREADGKQAAAAKAQPGAKPGGSGKPAQGGPPPEPPTHVAVDQVARGVALQRYTTTATLEAENRAEILARTGGVVAQLLVEEGDAVRTGQELLVLDDTEARLRVRAAEVELAKQQTIWGRQKTSFEQQLIPQSEFDLARTNFEAAEAALEIARHDLSYTRVQAPFAGTVVRRTANTGQTVNVGTALFEIASFRPLLARIYVPAKEMGTLGSGQDAELVLDSNGARVRGTVRLVSPVVDANTGTVKVTIGVHDYPPGTRPGDFVHASVVTARRLDALRVPNQAVFEDRGERVVYVARDSVAARRPVEVGFVDETHTEVVTGLQPGDLVIVKGQRSLKDGARIVVLDAGASKPEAADTVAGRQGS